MKNHSICSAVFTASWLASAVIAAPVPAPSDYPTRPIRLIAPFAPGGGVDVSARFISKQLSESFGQTAVVDNRPGAGSTIGTNLVAKAAPDGHTLLVTHNAIAINQLKNARKSSKRPALALNS